MKVEGLVFAAVAAFLFLSDVVYWFLSKDPTGTTALGLAALLAVMIAYYLLYTARRIEPRPEDRGEAEISDGAGEVGFFSPHSHWPVAAALAFSLTGLGLVFGLWLGIIGFTVLVVAASGFLFENFVGR